MKIRIKHKIMAFILCLTILLTNVISLSSSFVYGANTTKDSIGSINQEDDGINIGIDKTQNTNTSYSDEIELESSQNTDVYVSQSSTFGVFIPKVIVLNGEKDENGLNIANYVVSVSSYSNIGGMETINIVPEESFEMTSYGKNPIIANVTQDKVSWKYNELETKGNGIVSTREMSAGMWNGKFNFNISLSGSLFIGVVAKDENGIDLNASANEIDNENKDFLINSLINTGYISSENEITHMIEVKSDEFSNIANTTFNVSSIANENDVIVVLHYNEKTNEWEFIGKDIVDENGEITFNFTSFSPVVFVKIENDEIKEFPHKHNDSCYKTYTCRYSYVSNINKAKFDYSYSGYCSGHCYSSATSQQVYKTTGTHTSCGKTTTGTVTMTKCVRCGRIYNIKNTHTYEKLVCGFN